MKSGRPLISEIINQPIAIPSFDDFGTDFEKQLPMLLKGFDEMSDKKIGKKIKEIKSKLVEKKNDKTMPIIEKEMTELEANLDKFEREKIRINEIFKKLNAVYEDLNIIDLTGEPKEISKRDFEITKNETRLKDGMISKFEKQLEKFNSNPNARMQSSAIPGVGVMTPK